jgi:uncharacterized protein
MPPETALRRLKESLQRHTSLAVAFSGGVDSTLLLAVARQVVSGRLLAVTARSPLHPGLELRDAEKTVKIIGVEHTIFDSAEMASEDFLANTGQRCYICKRILFKAIFDIAAKAGIAAVAHGANVDDTTDYRPGMAAAEEMGVVAPLVEAGLGKAQIRTLSRKLDLATWDKPAMACLASRIPYGTPITQQALAMIEAAESALHRAGFAACRVRHHGDTARIEVAPGNRLALMAEPVRTDISRQLKLIGFSYVCVDMDGYVQGSLNRPLKIQDRGFK